MTVAYSYACKDYPGMEQCPGRVCAETEDEVLQLVALHARIAHGEDPAAWSAEERAQLKSLIRTETA